MTTQIHTIKISHDLKFSSNVIVPLRIKEFGHNMIIHKKGITGNLEREIKK